MLLLRKRIIDQPALRTVGWGLSLVALATLAHIVLPSYSPGPEIGAGGYLGAMGQTLLESHFATAGALILAMSILLAGLLLSTDYMFFRFAAATTAVSGRGLRTLGGAAIGRTKRDDRPDTDLENETFGQEEEDGDEYDDERVRRGRVRIRGRRGGRRRLGCGR